MSTHVDITLCTGWGRSRAAAEVRCGEALTDSPELGRHVDDQRTFPLALATQVRRQLANLRLQIFDQLLLQDQLRENPPRLRPRYEVVVGGVLAVVVVLAAVVELAVVVLPVVELAVFVFSAAAVRIAVCALLVVATVSVPPLLLLPNFLLALGQRTARAVYEKR